jgi:NTP pyrophosphatase (non-canonical NTP hydrolase)
VDDATWKLIRQLTVRFGTTEDPARHARLAFLVLKLTEETGEVAQALIGATGQNYRKGVTCGMSEVAKELCDVVVTALLTLSAVTPDPDRVLAAHVHELTQRSAWTPPRP